MDEDVDRHAQTAPDQASAQGDHIPLVVDLEDLVRTDLAAESLFLLARRQPARLLAVPFWLATGREHLKRQLARAAPPCITTLPYRQDLLAILEAAKHAGTPIVLRSKLQPALAQAIAAHLGLFQRVITSDEAGAGDEERLVAEFGAGGFDYLGREPAVREAARRALPWPAERRTPAEVYVRALRPHQWLKNALVLVPLVAAHRLYDGTLLLDCLLAIVAFSLAASSAYLINDLMDLPSDRHHPRKRQRPFASGELSPRHGALMIPLLIAGALGAALPLPSPFLAALGLYYLLTLGYSVRLKDVVILDVLTLAGLYALRVIGGSAAVGIAPSAWLLAFCVFLFFSLAMVKRYAELVAMRAVEGNQARARGYLLEDSELLAALGGASGYLAVLVLAFYVTSEAAPSPEVRYHLIWLVCLLLLYWISYMWLMAHRGRMHDDPLVFALRDRVSQILVALMAVIIFVAT